MMHYTGIMSELCAADLCYVENPTTFTRLTTFHEVTTKACAKV